MFTYKALFLLLFHAMTEAISHLEQQNFGAAIHCLKAAQDRCEECIFDLEE